LKLILSTSKFTLKLRNSKIEAHWNPQEAVRNTYSIIKYEIT
jgi:hypothetical protein